MRKTVIILNGKGGAGKDTLCDLAGQHFKIRNVSSITPIKEIALQNGWNGEKDHKSRRFLSELKRVFTEYNDLPTQYLLAQYEAFLQSEEELLFVQIREGSEIEKFKIKISGRCVTLLISREDTAISLGNASDDEVESYGYDYYYQNAQPLEHAGEDFIKYLQQEIIADA